MHNFNMYINNNVYREDPIANIVLESLDWVYIRPTSFIKNQITLLLSLC